MEPQAISSDLIRGHIDTIILYSLSDGDKFAQQISDAIEEKSENEYKIIQATLYSSLKRLETLKHVTSYWNDSPSGRRKYFRLTDTGKAAVESNLSSWSYSRAIIDKLMDCAPTPIYQTKVVEVEKIVEKVVEVEVPVVREVQVPVKMEETSQPVSPAPKIQTSIENTENHAETVQEVNFRAILSGLIKTNNQTLIDEKKEEIKPIENTKKVQEIAIEKPKFNETLTSINYNPNKSVHTGKIDFGDLSIKAAKEGYKLRVSSRESYVQVGSYLSNKLRLFSSILAFIVVMLEFLLISTYFGEILGLTVTIRSIACATLAIFPLIALLIYIAKPRKTTAKKVSVDSILTSAIIVFNLLLITLAANLLANVDFTNSALILLSAVIPCILYVDVLIYYIIRYFLSKTSLFILRRKKTA